MKKKIIVEYEILDLEKHESEFHLYQQALEATSSAYAPYSNFKVGTAVLLDDNQIVKASNQENAAYPSGMCAERTAIYFVGANHAGQEVLQIAVAAKNEMNEETNVTPCGACRQALLEYEHSQKKSISIIMKDAKGRLIKVKSIENLLPFSFNSNHLD